MTYNAPCFHFDFFSLMGNLALDIRHALDAYCSAIVSLMYLCLFFSINVPPFSTVAQFWPFFFFLSSMGVVFILVILLTMFSNSDFSYINRINLLIKIYCVMNDDDDDSMIHMNTNELIKTEAAINS